MTATPSTSGKAHLQATPEQIAELRERLNVLEAQVSTNLLRHRIYLTDRVLHRFLTSRNGNVNHTLDMLLAHLDWRIEYNIENILEENLSTPQLERLLFWCGFDLDGHPCIVVRPCEHNPNAESPEKMIRFFCQLLEKCFHDFAPAIKFCLILDCRGVG
ncbi:unnamed protein product, partial [Choristocarpus tenellus]